MTTRGPAESTPTETAPCRHAQVRCPSCRRALAALQAENAELRRMEAATDTTCHCGQPKDAHRGGCDAAARLADLSEARRLAVTALEATTAEAATLRERVAALSEHVARVTGERLQAEWERGRLRELLERVARGDRLETKAMLAIDAYLASHPSHTEGKASAPPKETTP